ncbi:transglutaminase N-terminal domain-containing protein [Kocuria sp. NPDC057446]|uniref:transglutaminase family protein n=1 Tax=Kocuria sp. NPDC057446 TaxID=3346137 RepID=UPI0036813AF4
MTRLKIDHVTRYDYNDNVSKSYNEARMTPLSDDEQIVLEAELTLSPGTATVSNYRDYWGTRVAAFDIQGRHRHLEVRSSATVEVHRRPGDEVADGLSWDELATPEVLDAVSDFVPQTPLTRLGPELEKVAEAIRKEAADPAAAAAAIFRGIASHMQYVPGVTGVHTDAEAAWREAKGVCQDLAHVAIGMMRHIGIPARYVSGYLHPDYEAGVGATVPGESHAWVEWWNDRWYAYDPTNHTRLTDFHVTVARGRDYTDVTPLKGMVTGGGGTSGLQVQVEVTQTA